MSLTLPRLLAGRYRLTRRLGEGSFAETFLATDILLQRQVAVKILRDQYARDPRFVAHFANEARAAAAVTHPNVVEVYDHGREGEILYIVMEWVDGSNLKNLMREKAPLPIPEAIRLLRELLHGLSAIHQAGITHRDVKPQNVLVTRQGRAKLTDFGIARGSVPSGLTETGVVVGTAAYMAPEQASGKPTGPAVDIYAAGVILFEMVTGRLPFPGEIPVEVMYRQVHEPVPCPRDLNRAISPELEAVILRALAKDPGQRYPTAGAMAAAMDGKGDAEATRVMRTVRAAGLGRAPVRRREPEPVRAPSRPSMTTTLEKQPPVDEQPRFERLVKRLTGPAGILIIVLFSVLTLGGVGQVVGGFLEKPIGAVSGAFHVVGDTIGAEKDHLTSTVGGTVDGVRGGIHSATQLWDGTVGRFLGTAAPDSGTTASGMATCPDVVEVQRQTGVPVYPLGGECGFHWDGYRIEGRCPRGYICTFNLGRRIAVIAGKNQSAEIVNAGTWRYVDAYSADSAVREPCVLLQDERDWAEQHSSDLPVEPVGFLCH
jgi:serine/threonine-protein kinase